MRKIKMLVAAAFVCAVGFTSYTAYDEATMTDAERMMQANIDALSEEVLTQVGGEGLGVTYWQTMSYCKGSIKLTCSRNAYSYYCSTAYCLD